MKFDDVLAIKPPTTPAEIRIIITEVLGADDLPSAEKEAFESGYIFGLMYGAMDEKSGIATELLLRMQEAVQ